MDCDRTVHRFDASSDDPEASWKNSTIAVRSNRDRGAIESRSWSVRCGINSTIVGDVFVKICSEIDAQSTHDQATIVVDRGRSRRKAWPGNAEIVEKLRPTHGRSRSCDIAPMNRSHDPCKPPPRPLQWPRLSGLISFFKSMYFPLLFFNFSSIRDGIKQISR